MCDRTLSKQSSRPYFAIHGWLGLALVAVFWPLNWLLTGPRTHWGFFPLWLGYCLAVDAVVLCRSSTSLLRRNWRKYVGLFLVSAPAWWLFEVLNWRVQNWHYVGRELFSNFEYGVLASLSFSTVMPAVFGTAELMSSLKLVRNIGRGPAILPTRFTTLFFFALGLTMLALMLAWPIYFFPFTWLSVFFIIEPINVWLGHHSLTKWTRQGDWRPIIALWLGVLVCAFFWEMWNYFSYPKWIYTVPWVNYLHIFEMPLLGYGGYLPFALELYAIYHLVAGLVGQRTGQYLRIAPDQTEYAQL
jgi:hypothetical protein